MERSQPARPPGPLTIEIPHGALVVLVGPSGAGKSTFARRHFRPTEILSSDAFRAMVADDEADQRSSRAAFEVLHHVALERLAARRVTVVDATNVRPAARKALLALAAATHRPAVAVVFDLPIDEYHARNGRRADRLVDAAVIDRQAVEFRRAADPARLTAEGFAAVHVLRGAEAIDLARIVRLPAPEPPSRARRRARDQGA